MQISGIYRLLALLFLALVSTGVQAEVWTAELVVKTALANSPDAKMARARVAGAQALVSQAQAVWYPQLNVSARYSETNSPMMAFGAILNQRSFGWGMDFNHPGRIDDLMLSGTVVYNLYSGGRDEAQNKAARAGARAALEDLRAARHQLAVESVRSLVNLRKAREAVLSVEAGVRAYEVAVASAKAQQESGKLLRSDLLSLEVLLAQTRETAVAARHAAQLSESALFFVMGVDKPLGPIELPAEDATLSSIAEAPAGDFSRRPELLALEERVRAAEAAVRAVKAGRLPSVNAFGSAQHNRGDKTGGDAGSWAAGLSVDLAVFDGGLTSGRVRAAKADLEQAREALRKIRLGLRLEMERAGHALAEARERLEVSRRSVEQAEESASLSRARFASGTLTTADLIGAESRLLEARMRRTAALADERFALVELRRAAGLSPVEAAETNN